MKTRKLCIISGYNIQDSLFSILDTAREHLNFTHME